MISSLVRALISAFKARRELALENVALRQQLAVLRRSVKRPRLSKVDRVFWVLLRRIWTDWEGVLVIVKPETVIRWHRCGFRRYWTWKSRRRRPGRPGVAPEIRELIRNMSRANPLWGAPRVHGELAKLGISISQAAVSKYMVRHRIPPSHTWRSFLDNHVKDLVSLDFWCFRCLLLVMCTYPFAKKALTLHLARGEGRERYFGCNLMQRKVLASSHQHLMAEAPYYCRAEGSCRRRR